MNLTFDEPLTSMSSSMNSQSSVFEAAATLLGLLETPGPGFPCRDDGKADTARAFPMQTLKRTREPRCQTPPMVVTPPRMLSPLGQPEHEADEPPQVSSSKCHTADFSTLLTAASSVASPSHSRRRGGSNSQGRKRPRITSSHAQDKRAVSFAPLTSSCPPPPSATARAAAGTSSAKKPTDATGTPAKKPARKRKTPLPGSTKRQLAPVALASASPHAPVPLAPAPSLTPSPAPPVKAMVGKLPLPPLPRRVGAATPTALPLPLPPWAWKKFAEEAQQQFKAACSRKENNGSTSTADPTAAATSGGAAGVAKVCGAPPELAMKLQELQRQQIQVMLALQGNAFAKVFPKSPAAVETSTPSSATPTARKRPTTISTVSSVEGLAQKTQEDSSPCLMPRPAAPHESDTPCCVGAGPAVVPLSPLL